MQLLRGSIYLRDGALERRRLAPDGTHRTPEDERSWHLLMLDKNSNVSACAWYFHHDNAVSIDDLRVRGCVLGATEGVGDRFRQAVASEIARAREAGLGYAEVGGWAAARAGGSTCEGLVLALAGYSLARICGGALGITTATVRHASSTILRRLGGSSIEVDGFTIPPYYDPTYRCSMELLRFDSRRPNEKYEGMIEQLREQLAEVLVIARPGVQGETTCDYASLRGQSVQPSCAA
jgi:hypothetical protein